MEQDCESDFHSAQNGLRAQALVHAFSLNTISPRHFSMLLAFGLLVLGCGSHQEGGADAAGEAPSAGAGFEVSLPGIGSELELPDVQLVHVKENSSGEYTLQPVVWKGFFNTSPVEKMVVASKAFSKGTEVPVFAVTGDIHMPFLRSVYARPSSEEETHEVLVSRTLELISGPEPASVAAQKKVMHHMSLFWTALAVSVVAWDDVTMVGDAWDDVLLKNGEVKETYGRVSPKRLVELGSVGNYHVPKIYGLAMLEDVVNLYNRLADDGFQLTRWEHGKDVALVLKRADASFVNPQASFGITARGYKDGRLQQNFSCAPGTKQSKLSPAALRKNCRGAGWSGEEVGITACFPSDCFGRACYLSGVAAFADAAASRPEYPLAGAAKSLLTELVDEGLATQAELDGPVGDAVKAGLIVLRCSTLALAQDVVAPEWRLKNMIGNLPKVTWGGFLDGDFGSLTEKIGAALSSLEESESLVEFACTPNGKKNIAPKLFISAPGDLKAEQTELARQEHCREGVKKVMGLTKSLGEGRAFTPGRIAEQPAFVVESRYGYVPVTQGFSAKERWSDGEPEELEFTGLIAETVEAVCRMSGFKFSGGHCSTGKR